MSATVERIGGGAPLDLESIESGGPAERRRGPAKSDGVSRYDAGGLLLAALFRPEAAQPDALMRGALGLPSFPHGPQLLGLSSLLAEIVDWLDGRDDPDPPRPASGKMAERSSQTDVRDGEPSADGSNGLGAETGSFSREVRHEIRRQGKTGVGGLQLAGSVDASAYAQFRARGRTSIDSNGWTAEGALEARAGLTAGAEGSVDTPIGRLSGTARARIEAYALVHGRAVVGPSGAQLSAEARAGALAGAESTARVTTTRVLGMQGEASARAYAQAGTTAYAGGEAVLTWNPPQALVSGHAGAFAGARAGVAVEAGFGPVAGHYGVEARTGIGIEAHFSAGIRADKLSIDFSIGGALGIGLGLNIKLEVDIKPITDLIGGIFSSVASMFGGGAGDGSHAARTVGDFVQSLARPPRGSGSDTRRPAAAPAATSSGETDHSPPPEETAPDPASWAESETRTWSGSKVVHS